MDLKNFVSETLTQIIEGVEDARKKIAEKDITAQINPTAVQEGKPKRGSKPKPVEFDVAVTVLDESASSSSIGGTAGFLSVISAKVDSSLEEKGALRNEAVSRIQFSVELSQPADNNWYEKPQRIKHVTY